LGSPREVVDEFRIVFCLCCNVYGHPEKWNTILSLSTVCVLTFGQTREVDKETVIVFYAL
jgi:hypothetical protein